MRLVDVNADVGEGLDDRLLMPSVTSVSIACGGHAGDAATMSAAVDAALEHNLLIGAHPGYPDREGFGRSGVIIERAHLVVELLSQLEALAGIASGRGATLSHVKAHGALYNRAAVDEDAAVAVTRAVLSFNPDLAVFCPPGSVMEMVAARRGLAVLREVFADRAYDGDGHLLPRDAPGAVITDPAGLPSQLDRLASLEFDTMCVHGDNPAAAALLPELRRLLAARDWQVAPYPAA